MITDFTHEDKIDLDVGIPNSLSPVCGIFKKSQLSEQFLKSAAATLIVTSCLTMTTFGQDGVKADSLITKDSLLTNDEDYVFGTFVENSAEPVGGYQKFYEALSKELKCPAGLTATGKCFVEFYIDTTGQTKDYKILKSFDPAVDQEVLRAMTTLNYRWKPAQLRNKSIGSRFVIPIAFDPLKK